MKWVPYQPERQTTAASRWSTAPVRRPTFFFFFTNNLIYARLLASHLKHTENMLILKCTQIVWKDKKK